MLRLRDLEEQLARETIEDDDEFAFERLKIHAKYFDGIIALRKEEIDDARNIFRINRELLILEEEQNEDSVKKFENIQKYRLDILRTSAEYQLMSDTEKQLARQQIIFDSEKQITKFIENEQKARTRIEQTAENTRMQIHMQAVRGFSALAQAAFKDSKGVAIAATIIETYVAAQLAYKQALAIPGVGIGTAQLAAAAAIASGLARVASIRNVEIGSGSGSTSDSGGSSFGVSVTDVGNQQFNPPSFAPSNDQSDSVAKAVAKSLAGSKFSVEGSKRGMYLFIKDGERQQSETLV